MYYDSTLYIYSNIDNKHYDYFDYIGAKVGIQQYEPDGDMDIVECKETIRKEWDAAKAPKSLINYDTIKLIELKKLCKESKIKGASTLNRQAVIDLLIAFDY